MRHDGFDMNLLKVFRAIWEERSISRAAERLNLSQSATSAALNRLRAAFADDLLVWDGRTMQPTRRAEALNEGVRRLLRETAGLLAEASQNVGQASRSFVIASFDTIERVMGPPLFAHQQREAPNLTITIMNAASSLSSGSGARVVDLFIVPDGAAPPGCNRSQMLYRDRYVGIVSRGVLGEGVRRLITDLPPTLPLIDGPGRPRQPGVLGRHLQRYTSTHFDFLADYVAKGQLLAILPRHIAIAKSEYLDFDILEFPEPVPSWEVSMHWRQVYDRDPFHEWLRGTIGKVSDGIQQRIDADRRPATADQ